jgi:two-component system nitrate/nitrite response regulator NarL
MAMPEDGTRKVLQPHERKVIKLVAEGKSNKEIAGELGLVEGSVKQYLHSACRVLHMHSRFEVIAWFYRNGLR